MSQTNKGKRSFPETDRRLTPEYILEAVREFAPDGRIALDPCTEPDNPTDAKVYYTREDDGLARDWNSIAERGGVVFVNPPFSVRAMWDERAIDAARSGGEVFVVSSSDHTTSWWECLYTKGFTPCLLRKRLKCEYPGDGRQRDVGPCTVWYSGDFEHRYKVVFGKLGYVWP